MLRLTKLTDYGILLLTRMAVSEHGLFAATELSETTRIPAPTVSKILQTLLHDGMLVSTRGARGGYRLARPAAEINVREIITVFEGSIALTECNLDGGSCDQSEVCSTSDNWKRINSAMLQALASISLEDMTEPDFVPVFRLQRGLALTEVAH